MKPEMKPLGAAFFAWSRSQLNLVGSGADPIRSEPESALEPRISGAGAGAAQQKWRFRSTEYLYLLSKDVKSTCKQTDTDRVIMTPVGEVQVLRDKKGLSIGRLREEMPYIPQIHG